MIGKFSDGETLEKKNWIILSKFRSLFISPANVLKQSCLSVYVEFIIFSNKYFIVIPVISIWSFLLLFWTSHNSLLTEETQRNPKMNDNLRLNIYYPFFWMGLTYFKVAQQQRWGGCIRGVRNVRVFSGKFRECTKWMIPCI